ncbi:hypothetical protein HB787_28020 (plasmid) [Klebsiella pneumoniae]|nr:hypothetical protein HB787_28020 [Klebsiella pneumoniae]
MGSCAAPSAKGDDKFITTDYLQQCHRYSVPESLCGQPVSIRISLDDELRIYSNEQQMASHRLCSAASGWQTVPEHHAPLWQQVSQVEPEI